MKYSWQFDPLQPDKPVELTCDGEVIATTTLNNAQALANKLNVYDDLYEACKAQHDAIDILFARLIELDRTFFPSKSGKPWQAVVQGFKAIAEAEGT